MIKNLIYLKQLLKLKPVCLDLKMKQAGSIMEDGVIGSPPADPPGNRAERTAEVGEEIW